MAEVNDERGITPNEITGSETTGSETKTAPTPPPTPDLNQPAFVPMPGGGLRELVDQLYPDDRDNADKRQQHLADLLALNSDTLRDEDTYMSGQMVRTR